MLCVTHPLKRLLQHTNALSEKDEEVNMVKKTCRGTINLLKDQVDMAEQEISRLVSSGSFRFVVRFVVRVFHS